MRKTVILLMYNGLPENCSICDNKAAKEQACVLLDGCVSKQFFKEDIDDGGYVDLGNGYEMYFIENVLVK